MQWIDTLEERHMADLTFSEVVRALRALSSTYVERRDRLARKTAFDTAGKRAAYAAFYSPLHYLTVTEVLRSINPGSMPHHILDLGCGAGAAGAAWASSAGAQVTGVDAHPWAVAEAAFAYRALNLKGETRRGDVGRVRIPRTVDAVVAGWVLNEVTASARDHIQRELLAAVARGTRVLIVEPIATRLAPWWTDWADTFIARGGRADEWRFRVELPDLLKRLDRAAGLRHDPLTARSLYVEAR
jgi:SAM-dependent methyltransferase